MHVIAKKGLALTAAVAGLLFAGTGIAMADSASATGSTTWSPGLGSGNNIQFPTNIPVCVNGNAAQVIGAANIAKDNKCTHSGATATLTQTSKGNPGFVAGNNIGWALNIPVGVNGNTISGIGVANASTDNTTTF